MLSPDGETQYLQALEKDWQGWLKNYPEINSRTLRSIFLGGGTPSLFHPKSIEKIITMLTTQTRLAPDLEVTMEANPGSMGEQVGDIEKALAGFASAGVNRLSIGVQSFDDKQLHRLGRIHSAKTARWTIEIASQWFARVNIDLMFGLPEQSQAQALADVQAALAFSPTHLSCYQLTIEPNTVFFHAPPRQPDDDTLAEMGDAIAGLLQSQGFNHYEVSAFALAGQECRHNLNYWQFGDFVGIGAGAHGKITTYDAHGKMSITREARLKRPSSYQTKILSGNEEEAEREAVERRTVAPVERPLEFMMNTLRLAEGFAIAKYESRTGEKFESVRPVLEALQSKGLLVISPERIAPTPMGRLHLNYILGKFQ